MRYFTPVENLLKNSSRYGDQVFLHQPINGQWHEFTWADVEQLVVLLQDLKHKGMSKEQK